jgi:hypothetical protein
LNGKAKNARRAMELAMVATIAPVALGRIAVAMLIGDEGHAAGGKGEVGGAR